MAMIATAARLRAILRLLAIEFLFLVGTTGEPAAGWFTSGVAVRPARTRVRATTLNRSVLSGVGGSSGGFTRVGGPTWWPRQLWVGKWKLEPLGASVRGHREVTTLARV